MINPNTKTAPTLPHRGGNAHAFTLAGIKEIFPRPLGRGLGRGVKAFTLAEVLITLGVIGVVSALTLPTVIKHYQQHVTVNRLKQTYSIISQAVRMSETENGLLETWTIPNAKNNNSKDCYNKSKQFFDQYLKQYIKFAKDCMASECFADSYIRPNSEIYNNILTTYNVILANGSVVGFYAHDTLANVYVDLNGKKGPNKYGRDFFTIVINRTPRNDDYGNFNKSGVYTLGQGKTKTELTSGQRGCSKTATTYAGTYCGALIMYDGWKITDDYPW